MSEKIVTVIMGENCERFIGMCIESIKDSDAIVFCDGGSRDKTREIFESYAKAQQGKFKWIYNNYNQEYTSMNGKQRNFYLSFLKENYPDDWALCLDCDEVVEDFEEIKKFINRAPPGCYFVKMRHLIGDLSHEDATQDKHWVPMRLFKISEAGYYPETEHPVLQPIKPPKNAIISATDCTTIWHLAYIPNMWEIKRRYENHMKKSQMHTPEFLKQWYYWHLFGTYPKKQFNPVELPKQLLNEFGIDKDELYFINRGIETKHPLMVKQWNEYFKPKKVLDLGCGRGPFLFFWSWFVEEYSGIEISQWAIKNAFIDRINQGDITKGMVCPFTPDLITCIDVLEHIDYENIDFVIDCIFNITEKYILISIPVIGNPDLENDSTHKIKETEEWWMKKFTDRGLKHIQTPEHFLFKNQIYIFSK